MESSFPNVPDNNPPEILTTATRDIPSPVDYETFKRELEQADLLHQQTNVSPIETTGDNVNQVLSQFFSPPLSNQVQELQLMSTPESSFSAFHTSSTPQPTFLLSNIEHFAPQPLNQQLYMQHVQAPYFNKETVLHEISDPTELDWIASCDVIVSNDGDIKMSEEDRKVYADYVKKMEKMLPPLTKEETDNLIRKYDDVVAEKFQIPKV